MPEISLKEHHIGQMNMPLKIVGRAGGLRKAPKRGQPYKLEAQGEWVSDMRMIHSLARRACNEKRQSLVGSHPQSQSFSGVCLFVC